MARSRRNPGSCTADDVEAPPWNADLERYQALRLALASRRAARHPARLCADGCLLDGRPVLNPVNAVATFDWPVHRIGPRYRRRTSDGMPVRLVLFRNVIGGVDHLVLGEQAEALIAELARRRVAGRRLINDLARRLAGEQGADPVGLQRGLAMLLEHFRARGLVIGSISHDPSHAGFEGRARREAA